MKKIISTENAPKAIGPYSQAVEAGNFIFLSGQIPLKADGNLIGGDIKNQTKQTLDNMGKILEAAGLDYDDIVKTTVYLSDLDDFKEMNEIYGEYFKDRHPARATIEVSGLPKKVKIEIDAIAVRK